jgi:hypothetical protein
MSVTAVLLPVFVQVALTFGLLIWMGVLRIGVVRSRTVQMRDIALGQPNWPKAVTQVQNSYQNQFELPVLFYVLIALALITAHTSVVLVALSWLFVLSRLVHAAVHTTSNHVPRRFYAYNAGMAVLILMWLWFAASVIA